MSRAEEQRWIGVMLERLDAQDRRRGGRASRGDAQLQARAAELSRLYFGGATKPSSVRWVDNQNSRWGSCTPSDATIRLSHRLRTMPSWVIDYVLVHELAHLIEIGHGPRFQTLVDRYPKAERARGYLLGVAATTGSASDDPDAELDDASSDGGPGGGPDGGASSTPASAAECAPQGSVPPPLPERRRPPTSDAERTLGLLW
jgi:hypothetical protein